MENFTMEIAGAVVGVTPMFQSTREYCRPYLSDKDPELFVKVSTEDLAFEQKMLEQEAIEEGLKTASLPIRFWSVHLYNAG